MAQNEKPSESLSLFLFHPAITPSSSCFKSVMELNGAPSLEADTAAALLAFRLSQSVPKASSIVAVPSRTNNSEPQQCPLQVQKAGISQASPKVKGTQGTVVSSSHLETVNAATLPFDPHLPPGPIRSLQNSMLSSLLFPQATNLPSCTPAATTLLSDVNVDIRKEEVEKALKSKPQRGRKRSNLNQDERQLLAQTRNREHAKKTRIRKKQRHQELVEIEQKYQERLRHDELKALRKAAAMEFLRLRQAGHFSLLPPNKQAAPSGLARFCESLLSYTDSVNGSIVARGGYETMKEVDAALRQLVVKRFGPGEEVEVLHQDLAHSDDTNSTFVQVNFRLRRSKELIKSSLVKLVYESKSNHIITVEETRLQDIPPEKSAVRRLTPSPSVVSLEDKTTEEVEKELADSKGHGASLLADHQPRACDVTGQTFE